MNYREEQDTMGTVRIPEDAYYGPQTQRAIENFAVSGMTFPPVFIYALALIKQCSARVNGDLELLDGVIVRRIVDAAQEVMDGKFDEVITWDMI